ncbi:unnamed protein product [Dibothriocephalus latus]|uniref:UspA domain-containing protein n=1 Tax=Dibothriocephalus latus TaxID=60516 RepID=A0A3P6QJ97_DIBLA|nr:unnamed protein product [Dibothriocephalus latus]
MAAKRVVLIPLDGGENSEWAFKWYLKRSKQPRDFLILLHVVEGTLVTTSKAGLDEESRAVLCESLNEHLQTDIKLGRKLLEKFSQMCKEVDLKHKVTVHVDDKPGDAVIKVAQQYKANLIIMGSRGINKVRRTFLGSTSDHVLHHSAVPVLLVPAKKRNRPSFTVS